MQEILFDYKLNPTTWAYVSALMLIGTYFKFRRLWSVRNLDLFGLILYSPALLLIYYGLLKETQLPLEGSNLIRAGYVWLFIVSAFFLVRMLLDPLMVRRPLLDPNLSAGGLVFTGISLLIFLMANVVTRPPERLERMLTRQAAAEQPSPGFAPFHTFAAASNRALPTIDQASPEAYRLATIRAIAAQTVVILAHLGVVLGMVWIGFRHFGNIQTGVAMATLYLLTFYTSQLTSQVDHVVPAMLLVWSVATYRWPAIAGIFLGLAAGLIFYPLFLLPLWLAFYWRRGLVRFACGFAAVLLAFIVVEALSAQGWGDFANRMFQMFGWQSLVLANPTGFWKFYEPAYRIPVLAAFAVLSFGLAIWPAQKNLGTLLSCSTAVMIASQFCHTNSGGLHMAWYLPLLILTIFRPNLEDRIAFSAVHPFWRRKARPASIEAA